jgi:hypothetical protein
METPRVLIRDPAGYAGVWRDLHFDLWLQPGGARQIRERAAAQMAWLATLPPERHVVSIAVVHGPAAKPLDAETRAALDQSVTETRPRVKASAVVLQAEGFKAVVVRSIIAALTLVNGSRTPMKTFDQVDGALAWAHPFLDDHGGRAPTLDEIAAAWGELQRQATAVAA